MKRPPQNTTRWEWDIDGRQYSAQVFPRTQTIIWATWRETGEGPKFEPGRRQLFEDFNARGVPDGLPVPEQVLAEMRMETARGVSRKGRGFFRF